MRDDQRQRVVVVAARVDEVDLLAVDIGEEVRPAIEPLLFCTPVELGALVVAEILEVREVGAVIPAAVRNLVGPACACKAFA